MLKESARGRLGILCALACALALAAPAMAQARSILAQGSTAAGEQFFVSATTTTGDAARGTVLLQDDDGQIMGSVGCLRTSGAYATVGLTIGLGSGSAFGHGGEAFYVHLQDGRVTSTADRFDTGGYTASTSLSCPEPAAVGGEAVTFGFVDVQAARAVRRHRRTCKAARGWRDKSAPRPSRRRHARC